VARKLLNYLTWRGNKCKIFNVGKYRRQAAAELYGAEHEEGEEESGHHDDIQQSNYAETVDDKDNDDADSDIALVRLLLLLLFNMVVASSSSQASASRSATSATFCLSLAASSFVSSKKLASQPTFIPFLPLLPAELLLILSAIERDSVRVAVGVKGDQPARRKMAGAAIVVVVVVLLSYYFLGCLFVPQGATA